MLIVTEQHGIDRPNSGRSDGRPRRLGQSDLWQLIVTRLVEGRIGQETESTKLDERGGTANQVMRAVMPSPVCQLAGADRVTR